MKHVFTLSLFFCFTSILFSQSITDKELEKLATDLTSKVAGGMHGQNIALADFVDENDEPSQLGKYLAEELSFTLVNKSANFKIIDRTQLRLLLKEAGLSSKGMIDPTSVQKLGSLKGITAVIYGKLFPTGNYLNVYIKVVILEGQENVITVRGRLTRTPNIITLEGKENTTPSVVDCPPCNCPELPNVKKETVQSFKNQNIQIELQGCSRNGNNVDCQFKIVSIGINDQFAIKKTGTELFNASGQKYAAALLSMNGKNSSIQVNQSIGANSATAAAVRFSNVRNDTNFIPYLSLGCHSYQAFDFTAKFENIPIQ